MNAPIALSRHHSTNQIPILQNPKHYKTHNFSNVKLPGTIFTNSFRTFCSLNNRFTAKFSYKTRYFESNRLRASSNDAQSIAGSSSFGDQNEVREPSFLEFITSERVKVVAMLALALALCNADRVVMSVAIVPLSLAHGWRQSFAGVVQSSFLWGYMISPIPGGTLVDYYGGKVVMAWGVALWSLATFLTPWAAETSVLALLAVRMLLGIAEGVALPCMNNMIARWFPQTERARVVGLAMAGFQLGSAIGLTLSPILMSQRGLSGPFVIFGLCGFLWVLIWVSATSSTPEQSPQISVYELRYIQNKVAVTSLSKNEKKTREVIPPFRRLLSKLPTWSLIVANSMHSWGFFSIGFIGPGIALIGLTTAKSPLLASAWLTVAVGLKAFSHCGFLVNLQEIAPQYSGVLHGISNTAGSFAAMVGTVGAGFFVELVGSFKGFLLLTAFLYISAALFWNLFSTGERVNFDETT
ncbi:unnamed protein product [Fraxinus pennsylvanica]|uniref:Major facilitator superfamily (MFS) profile domain-containing protein n=1 Tax=Fraxinus pennsylvanica TaxID=56036 RepID=A0AAD1YX65_9LAMI|nr:unnamed protein product [Fraxinus pennsylvanica]